MGLLAFIGIHLVVIIGSNLLMDYSVGRALPPPSEYSILARIQYCFFHRRCLEAFLALNVMYFAWEVFTAIETGDWSQLKPKPLRYMVSSWLEIALMLWVGGAITVAFQYHGWTGEQLFCRFAEYAIARLEEAKSTHSAAPLGGGGGFNVTT